MTGNWKTNQGSAMLEQMPITEKYKNWIDEVSGRAIFRRRSIASSAKTLLGDQMQFAALFMG